VAFTNAEVVFNGGRRPRCGYFRDEAFERPRGAGTVRYQRCSLHAGQPVTRVVPMAEIPCWQDAGSARQPDNLSFALDENTAPIEQLAPGVQETKR